MSPVVDFNWAAVDFDWAVVDFDWAAVDFDCAVGFSWKRASGFS